MKKRDTLEIPQEAWEDYLTSLSNRERAHPVRIRIEGAELGDQVLAEGMPLVGISLARKGSEAKAIEVTLAHEDESNLTHMIRTPERVYVEEGDDGQVMVVDIEDTARVKTLIFFDRYPELESGEGD